jgi:mRNA interferase YafQ
MWQPFYTNRFQKSLARCAKRGYNIYAVKEIVALLVEGKPLPDRCRPHKLSGEFGSCLECHIKPDWLLIYRYDEECRHIIFEDTGTHSDLF